MSKHFDYTDFEQPSFFRALGEKIFKRVQDNFCAWPSENVSWSLIKPADYIEYNTCIDVLSDAIDLWSQSSALIPSFSDSDDAAQIKIGFYTEEEKPILYNEERQLSRNAWAYFPCEKNKAKRGWIFFNLKRNWALDQKNSHGNPYLYNFAVHEFGHAVGMKKHGYPTLDVMQKNPEEWNGELSGDDIEKIQTLYPMQEEAPYV